MTKNNDEPDIPDDSPTVFSGGSRYGNNNNNVPAAQSGSGRNGQAVQDVQNARGVRNVQDESIDDRYYHQHRQNKRNNGRNRRRGRNYNRYQFKRKNNNFQRNYQPMFNQCGVNIHSQYDMIIINQPNGFRGFEMVKYTDNKRNRFDRIRNMITIKRTATQMAQSNVLTNNQILFNEHISVNGLIRDPIRDRRPLNPRLQKLTQPFTSEFAASLPVSAPADSSYKLTQKMVDDNEALLITKRFFDKALANKNVFEMEIFNNKMKQGYCAVITGMLRNTIATALAQAQREFKSKMDECKANQDIIDRLKHNY